MIEVIDWHPLLVLRNTILICGGKDAMVENRLTEGIKCRGIVLKMNDRIGWKFILKYYIETAVRRRMGSMPKKTICQAR